jgi:hypothetical protein
MNCSGEAAKRVNEKDRGDRAERLIGEELTAYLEESLFEPRSVDDAKALQILGREGMRRAASHGRKESICGAWASLGPLYASPSVPTAAGRIVRSVEEPQDGDRAERYAEIQEKLARLRRRQATLVMILLLIGGWSMYELAQEWPGHPKTLARGAVICGFLGGVLVVRELVRGLLENMKGVTVGLFSATAGAGFAVIGLGALVTFGIIAVTVFLYRIVERVVTQASDGEQLREKVAAATPQVALALGFLLLLLGLFLQLRAIELGKV